MGNCEYVRETYGVNAKIGRRVVVSGDAGVIAEDRGNYIGVNFDKDKPGVITNCHPTWKVEYLEIGKIRKMTKSQLKYRLYLKYGDGFNNFMEFIHFFDANAKYYGWIK